MSFWRRLAWSSPPRHRLPDGVRVYAVGDVHGRADLLRPMLRWLREDHEARGPTDEVHVVFLGDLIDRGAQSAGVLDLLLDDVDAFGRRHFLMGNHEEVLLSVLDGDLTLAADWIDMGGAETLQSYGVDPALYWRDTETFRRRLAGALPRRHLAFLRGMEDMLRLGDYLFVHAGIRPGVPLDAQQPHDLRWIRREFLRSRADHGVMVVHGHTITETVDLQRNRIGIDTGAYRTGRLTALGLEGPSCWTLASRLDGP